MFCSVRIVTTAISVSGLVKTFGATRALDGLDLSVSTGEVHGFLGPNGSGKTTTIRVLLGLLRADAGEVTLLGGDPWHDAVDLHRHLAYVPGDVTLWPKLSGGEIIDLFGRLRGDLDTHRRDALLQRFELDPTKKSRTYSKGNRQKVALVAALASDAELLILDEPTSGLDPLLQHELLTLLEDRVDEGATVFLSSHVLPEVERVADRIGILRQGQLVALGTVDAVRATARHRIDLHLAEPAHAAPFRSLPGVVDAEFHGIVLTVTIEGSVDPIVKRAAQLEVHRIVSHEADLEDAFLELYR